MLWVVLAGAEDASAQSGAAAGPSLSPIALVPPLVGPGQVLIQAAGQHPATSEDVGRSHLFASLLVPGSGQLMSGQGTHRGWVMLGLDLMLWSAFALEERAGNRDRDRYRDLAWTAARDQGQLRVEGDFNYYERMTQWIASGAFDADALTPGIQPETRLETFNGDAWRLARSLFLGGAAGDPDAPGYGVALEYYAGRAYPKALLWDWSGAQSDQAVFKGLIRSSDDHRRRATWAVAGAIGNRVVSFLDLYISSRSGGRLGMDLEPDRGRSARLSIRWLPSKTGGTPP